jgi:hypothetical protein
VSELATGSGTGAIKRDAAGPIERTFLGGEGSWGNVGYTPDGRYLFSAFADGTAYRWPVTVGAWQDQACRVAGRNFTHEEWRRFVAGRSYERVCPEFPAER